MTWTMAEVEAAALELRLDERARLVERILASLEEDDAADGAWADEIDRRLAEYRSGIVTPVAAEEVFARLEKR